MLLYPGIYEFICRFDKPFLKIIKVRNILFKRHMNKYHFGFISVFLNISQSTSVDVITERCSRIIGNMYSKAGTIQKRFKTVSIKTCFIGDPVDFSCEFKIQLVFYNRLLPEAYHIIEIIAVQYPNKLTDAFFFVIFQYKIMKFATETGNQLFA